MAVDIGCAVEEEPERMGADSHHQIHGADSEPGQRVLARIDQGQCQAGATARRGDQGGHVVVAAQNSIERDQIRWWDLVTGVDQVAAAVRDAFGVAALFGFEPGDGEVRGRGIEVCATARAELHQFVLDRPDPPADVEEGGTAYTDRLQGVEQEACRARGTAPVVAAQLSPGDRFVELPFDSDALWTGHADNLPHRLGRGNGRRTWVEDPSGEDRGVPRRSGVMMDAWLLRPETRSRV